MKNRNWVSSIVTLTLLWCVIACKEDEAPPLIPKVPVLSTLEVKSIADTKAISGGLILDEGSSAITSRGVCWGTSPGPTILDNKTTDNNGTDTFTSSMSLTRNSVYYVRAYATNSAGTAYGNELSFKTFEVMDIDGNGYFSVTIGSQVWLIENLRVTHYRNGDAIVQVTGNSEWSNLTTGAFCYFKNDASNIDNLGLLYNWYAIADVRNVSPSGWHVATDSEWETLVNHLGGSAIAGGKLKETGTKHWYTPNIASNSSGFSGISGGQRALDGEFYGPGSYGCFWTSSDESETAGRDWFLFSGDETATRYYDSKIAGFNVRCIKD